MGSFNAPQNSDPSPAFKINIYNSNRSLVISTSTDTSNIILTGLQPNNLKIVNVISQFPEIFYKFYVIISNGNQYVRALAKVVGDYEYNQNAPIRYDHFRAVEWIFTDENIPIEEIYEKGLSQKTMYKIDESLLKKDFFIQKNEKVFFKNTINRSEFNSRYANWRINRANNKEAYVHSKFKRGFSFTV